MHRSTSGQPAPNTDSSTFLAAIAAAINRVDAGLSGLQELLDRGTGPVSAEGIAALIRPHIDSLRRASAELNDLV